MRKIVGIHTCKEALIHHPDSIKSLWVKSGSDPKGALVEIFKLSQKNKIFIQEKSKPFLDKISSSHQGVCIELSYKPELDWESLEEEGPSLVLILDGIEDPHNLGAILRTAWIMGAKALFIPDRRSTTLTPTACKVSCGASEHTPVEKVKNLIPLLKDLQGMGYWVYGLDANTKSSFWDVEFPEKVALVVGSEGKGLRDGVKKDCDQLLNIPQVVKDASLNASVATASAVMEVCRQHRLL